MNEQMIGSDELNEYAEGVQIETDEAGILSQKGRPVTFQNMEEAAECMKKLYGAFSAQEHGLGLAAQQVGYDLNMFVAVVHGELRLFINPLYERIKPTKYTHEYEEGCLSLPDRKFLVKRCSVIRARWQDAYMKWHEARFRDMDAVVFQHEYDHTRGILISQIGTEKSEEAPARLNL